MSKERLEGIKKRLSAPFLKLGRMSGKTQLFNDLQWLIEQAERVQELEKELYGNDIQMGYKRMYGVCNRDYAKLFQENKRYREALKLIMRRTDYELYPDLIQINTIAWKALEDNE